MFMIKLLKNKTFYKHFKKGLQYDKLAFQLVLLLHHNSKLKYRNYSSTKHIE